MVAAAAGPGLALLPPRLAPTDPASPGSSHWKTAPTLSGSALPSSMPITLAMRKAQSLWACRTTCHVFLHPAWGLSAGLTQGTLGLHELHGEIALSTAIGSAQKKHIAWPSECVAGLWRKPTGSARLFSSQPYSRTTVLSDEVELGSQEGKRELAPAPWRGRAEEGVGGSRWHNRERSKGYHSDHAEGPFNQLRATPEHRVPAARESTFSSGESRADYRIWKVTKPQLTPLPAQGQVSVPGHATGTEAVRRQPQSPSVPNGSFAEGQRDRFGADRRAGGSQGPWRKSHSRAVLTTEAVPAAADKESAAIDEAQEAQHFKYIEGPPRDVWTRQGPPEASQLSSDTRWPSSASAAGSLHEPRDRLQDSRAYPNGGTAGDWEAVARILPAVGAEEMWYDQAAAWEPSAVDFRLQLATPTDVAGAIRVEEHSAVLQQHAEFPADTSHGKPTESHQGTDGPALDERLKQVKAKGFPKPREAPAEGKHKVRAAAPAPKKPQAAEDATAAKVAGVVVGLTYQNLQSGWTVARVKLRTATAMPAGLPVAGTEVEGAEEGVKSSRARSQPVEGVWKVVGVLGSLAVGQSLQFNGQWRASKYGGWEFAAERSQEVLPETEADIRGYAAYHNLHP